MGIEGLLPYLKSAGVLSNDVSIRQYAGCTVGVDAYVWLNQGIGACPVKLWNGESTDLHIQHCMKLVNLLLRYNIKPIMVFDGFSLPAKKNEDQKRHNDRERNKEEVNKLIRQGQGAGDELVKLIRRGMHATQEMARQLIKECRRKGVDCIVAPYEADAQLAYLSRLGLINFVISEDSDMLVFGCEKVLYKFDENGNGVMIEKRHLDQLFDYGSDSFLKFRRMCILSGCDYLPSLTGIGLATAHQAMKALRETRTERMLQDLPRVIPTRISPITTNYIEDFVQAENTFLYQLVFDTRSRQLVPLNPYPSGVTSAKMPYAGEYKSNPLEIAAGNVDIKTGVRVDNFSPPVNQSTSIWSPHYRP